MSASPSGERYGAVAVSTGGEGTSGKETNVATGEKNEHVERGDGWPSWALAPWGGPGGGAGVATTRSLRGTREGVLLSIWGMEAAKAFVVAAVVSTLASGLFHADADGQRATRTDASTPWRELCGANGNPANPVPNQRRCAHSPTQIVAVQLVLVLGSLGAFPFAARLADAKRPYGGFPAALFVAATVAPVVTFGYAIVGVTKVTPALVLVRVLAGVYVSFAELGQDTAVSVAFAPAKTAGAFGSRVASASVFGIAAPVLIARVSATVGTRDVFTACAYLWVLVWVCVLVWVVVPVVTNAELQVNGGDDGDDETTETTTKPAEENAVSKGDTNTKEEDKKQQQVAELELEHNSRRRTLHGAWRELFVDAETQLLLFLSACVGTAEFALEGPVMLFLTGVCGFGTAENAFFLSVYNVPRGFVALCAEQVLRSVPARWLASGGLCCASCGVLSLALIGQSEDFTTRVWPIYGSAFMLGLGVASVHVATPPLLAQAAQKPRHGGRYGAAFGLSALAAKAGGGAVGMGCAAVAIEFVGFTGALCGVSSVLFIGSIAIAVRGGNLNVRFE